MAERYIHSLASSSVSWPSPQWCCSLLTWVWCRPSPALEAQTDLRFHPVLSKCHRNPWPGDRSCQTILSSCCRLRWHPRRWGCSCRLAPAEGAYWKQIWLSDEDILNDESDRLTSRCYPFCDSSSQSFAWCRDAAPNVSIQPSSDSVFPLAFGAKAELQEVRTAREQ